MKNVRNIGNTLGSFSFLLCSLKNINKVKEQMDAVNRVNQKQNTKY